MSYATTAQLAARIGASAYANLTDIAAGTTPNDSVGEEAIDSAAASVDAYLGGRYQTPIDTTSNTVLANILRRWTLAIAEWSLYATHGRRTTIPERVQAGYDDAVGQLESIAAGDSGLPGGTELPSSIASGFTALAGGTDKILTRDAMEDF